MFAPLGKEEIEYFLNYVTVYAITSKSDTNALFLVQEKKKEGGEEKEKEKGEEKSPKNVGYFFISKDMAKNMLSKLNTESREDAEIQAYYLGRVWNTLLFPPVKSPATEEVVEYRIIPDKDDVAQAQELYYKSIAGDDTKKPKDAPFQNTNEVPIFMDLNLRLATPGGENENESCFPMYLSYRDLASTCQDYVLQEENDSDTKKKTFQPMISVGELSSLVKQMKQPGQTDFRIAALVGPTMSIVVMKDEEEKEKEESKKEQEKVKDTIKNKNKKNGKKDDEDDDSTYEPTIQW